MADGKEKGRCPLISCKVYAEKFAKHTEESLAEIGKAFFYLLLLMIPILMKFRENKGG